jgi:outer membrane lipoprotein-sorting protein
MLKYIVLLLVGFMFGPAWADPQADSLMKCLESSGLGQTSGFKMKQVIKREGQAPRTFQAESYLTGKAEKLLVKFEEPADMAGVKLLFWDQGKQLWTYFPSTNRVRKMAGASSGQPIGSLGFTYDDLFPYLDKNTYTATVTGEQDVAGTACRVVELAHNANSASTYKKSRIFIGKEQCRLCQSQFFGANDRLLKTVAFEKYETVEGRTIPIEIRIAQPDLGEESVIKILAVEFSKDYGSTFFSERSLKR